MIQRRHLAPLAAALLLLAACNKEEATPATEQTGVPEGRMAISIEDVNSATGSKVLVSGLRSYWKNGETVWINGNRNYVVVDYDAAGTADEPRTYLQNEVNPINNNEYYIATTKNSNDLADLSSYTIPDNGRTFRMLPPVSSPMEYSEVNGRPYLSVPLVAVAPRTATTLNFKNVTAMVNVAVHNGIHSTFRILNVTVSTTSDYYLRGIPSVTVYPDGSVSVLPMSGNTASYKSLAVTFPVTGNEGLLSYGETKNVPVPILPLPADVPLTVKVTGFYEGEQPAGTMSEESVSDASQLSFTRTVTLTNALPRNSFVNANVMLSTEYLTTNNFTLFTIADNPTQTCFIDKRGRTGNHVMTADNWGTLLNNEDRSELRSLMVRDTNGYKLLIFPDGTPMPASITDAMREAANLDCPDIPSVRHPQAIPDIYHTNTTSTYSIYCNPIDRSTLPTNYVELISQLPVITVDSTTYWDNTLNTRVKTKTTKTEYTFNYSGISLSLYSSVTSRYKLVYNYGQGFSWESGYTYEWQAYGQTTSQGILCNKASYRDGTNFKVYRNQ
ncbi:MAG: hypothetical protein SPL12_05145 [Bacteroidales bacterium]|nr:hypothetical protein [Bacteroidales bacterium]